MEPNKKDDKKVDRRSFLNRPPGVVAGSAFASSALSYAASSAPTTGSPWAISASATAAAGLHLMAVAARRTAQVETVAVCDLWKNNRERAVADTERYYGRAPRALQHPEELLALKDVDAVMIATPEHSHSPVLKATVEGGEARVLRKADGERAGGSESGARRGQAAQSRRPDRHAAPQRTVPAGRA